MKIVKFDSPEIFLGFFIEHYKKLSCLGFELLTEKGFWKMMAMSDFQ
jgi:hypothetical protein